LINREKVIRHIAAEISIARTCKKDFASVDIDMLSDAYDLLKEQEAHVLTLDEAVDGNGCYYVEFQYHLDMGWVKCDFSRMDLYGEVAMLFIRDKNFYQQKEHYGKLWRLWNKRPTYDQIQAVKWE
jgi:hypothetical protein